MGIGFDELKNIANGENVDQAAEFAKSRFGEHADKIDAIADRAKRFLGDESPASDEGGGEETPAEGG